MNLLNSLSEISESLETQEKSLIMFSTRWCGACKKMKKKMETLLDIYPNVSFNSADITQFEDEDEVIEKYDIKKIPTFVFYKNSVEYSRVSGSKNRQDILFLLEKLNKIETDTDAKTETETETETEVQAES